MSVQRQLAAERLWVDALQAALVTLLDADTPDEAHRAIRDARELLDDLATRSEPVGFDWPPDAGPLPAPPPCADTTNIIRADTSSDDVHVCQRCGGEKTADEMLRNRHGITKTCSACHSAAVSRARQEREAKRGAGNGTPAPTKARVAAERAAPKVDRPRSEKPEPKKPARRDGFDATASDLAVPRGDRTYDLRCDTHGVVRTITPPVDDAEWMAAERIVEGLTHGCPVTAELVDRVERGATPQPRHRNVA